VGAKRKRKKNTSIFTFMPFLIKNQKPPLVPIIFLNSQDASQLFYAQKLSFIEVSAFFFKKKKIIIILEINSFFLAASVHQEIISVHRAYSTFLRWHQNKYSLSSSLSLSLFSLMMMMMSVCMCIII
jgi:hypothetical protein